MYDFSQQSSASRSILDWTLAGVVFNKYSLNPSPIQLYPQLFLIWKPIGNILIDFGHQDSSTQLPPQTFASKKSKRGVYYNQYFTIDKSDP